MKCFASITLLAILAASVFGSPTRGIVNMTEDPIAAGALLVERDNYGLCRPNQRAFREQEVNNAYAAGKKREVSGDRIAAKGRKMTRYPRYFGNKFIYPQGTGPMISLEGTGCQQSWELREFPIVQGGYPAGEWKGGEARNDRVVFGRARNTNGPWIGCFIMTHEGAGYEGDFRRCRCLDK